MTSLRIPVEHDNADIPNSADFLANVTPPIRIRCGDHVLHRPSGETWVVAYADYGTGELSACGWPDSIARISDCDLVKVASEQEHTDLLAKLIESGDRRGRVAERIYCPDVGGARL